MGKKAWMKEESVARVGRIAKGVGARDLLKGGKGGPAWFAIAA